jgi:hypothetical protein
VVIGWLSPPVRKGEQPPWIVPDGLWARIEPLPPVMPRRSVTAGAGDAVFAGAARVLLSWQVHLRAGLRVAASSPAWCRVLGLGVGPLRVAAPCRVIYFAGSRCPSVRCVGNDALPGQAPGPGLQLLVVQQHRSAAAAKTPAPYQARPESTQRGKKTTGSEHAAPARKGRRAGQPV